MSDARNRENEKFCVLAEADGATQPLLLLNLSFGRLMDDVVVPYQTDQPFFVDGASLTKQKLRKLKIVKLYDGFENCFDEFHGQLRFSGESWSKMLGQQYQVRLEAVIRESGEDVTSQIVTAFEKRIRPNLKEYLPKRDELIKAAFELFVASVKQLAGS